MDLLHRFETEFQRKVLQEALRPEFGPAESLRVLLDAAIAVRGNQPLLRNLTDEDAEVLLRRIPATEAQRLVEADAACPYAASLPSDNTRKTDHR